LNLEPETVAVAWNVMLPEHILRAWEAFQWNRVIGPGLNNESEISKVRFQELIFRLRYHSALWTERFNELERFLGEERTKQLIALVQTVFDEIVRLEHLDWKPQPPLVPTMSNILRYSELLHRSYFVKLK